MIENMHIMCIYRDTYNYMAGPYNFILKKLNVLYNVNYIRDVTWGSLTVSFLLCQAWRRVSSCS